jgi:formylglycine-generating enzyme required for sulfatase activity
VNRGLRDPDESVFFELLRKDYRMKKTITLLCTLILTTAAYGARMPDSKEFTNPIGMKFVRVEPGSFLMGQPEGGDFDERPTHDVEITRAFFVCTTEVTNAQTKSSGLVGVR